MNTPDEMRKYLGMMRNPYKVREKQSTNEEKPKKNMSMRDMLGKMRTINEAYSPVETTPIDQKTQEEKMYNYFNDDNIVIDFEPLDVQDNGVWWGGTLNNNIDWAYWVSDIQNMNQIHINNVKIDNIDNFDLNDEKIRQITDRLEGSDIPPEKAEELVRKLLAYYKEFADYWIDSKLQK